MQNNNNKGYSLFELIIVMNLIALMAFGMMKTGNDFVTMNQQVKSCVSYQDLVNSTEDNMDKPVEFKSSNIQFKRDSKFPESCTFDVGNYNKTIYDRTVLVSVAQAIEDVNSGKLHSIQKVTETPKEESNVFIWILLGFIVFFLLIVGVVSISSGSSTATEQEKKEAEEKFKALQNQVLQTKTKEKEEIKTSKKIYI